MEGTANKESEGDDQVKQERIPRTKPCNTVQENHLLVAASKPSRIHTRGAPLTEGHQPVLSERAPRSAAPQRVMMALAYLHLQVILASGGFKMQRGLGFDAKHETKEQPVSIYDSTGEHLSLSAELRRVVDHHRKIFTSIVALPAKGISSRLDLLPTHARHQADLSSQKPQKKVNTVRCRVFGGETRESISGLRLC